MIGVIARHLELSPSQRFDVRILAVMESQHGHLHFLPRPVYCTVGVDVNHLLSIQFAFVIMPDIHQSDRWRGMVAFSGCMYPVTPMGLF